VVGGFSLVVGYTSFGNFFLLDPETQRHAVLYTIGPELAPTNFWGGERFRDRFLTDGGIIQFLGRPPDIEVLEARLGPLGEDEVYVPVPFPFLGGSGELDTYEKANVWVFADLVAQMQGVGV